MKYRFSSIISQRILTAVLISILMLGSFISGNITGYLAHPVLAADEPSEFAIFWEAWDLVIDNFVDREKIDFKAMTYGAIQGMLDSLGDANHTVFFTPEVAEQQASSMEGSFEGIGAYVSQEEGVFKIIAPIHGSPAETAGILAGDTVVSVDGEDITGRPQWEVISKIRGPAGTTVTLTVLHPDTIDLVDVVITRGHIDIESVLWSRIPGTDLIYLQVTQFAADTSKELEATLNEINDLASQGESVGGILLDLRNNPGGFLRQALLVGSQFLEKGTIILHERDADGNISTYNSLGTGLADEYPIVVLINEGSASAAEILAGSLKENGRAKLIGEMTLGTGTVLRPYTLSDGSVIRLGVTNWLTPNYNLIKDQGVRPDVTVTQEASVEMVNSFILDEINAAELRKQGDRQFNMGLLFLKLKSQP